MTIPHTAKEIVENLKNIFGYSHQEIIKNSHLSRRTLYRILNNKPISSAVDLRLMLFYIQHHFTGFKNK